MNQIQIQRDAREKLFIRLRLSFGYATFITSHSPNLVNTAKNTAI